jgi:hypothetical protein
MAIATVLAKMEADGTTEHIDCRGARVLKWGMDDPPFLAYQIS